MQENICGDVLQYLLWNSPSSGFHVWASLQRIEKVKVQKENTFLVQPS